MHVDQTERIDNPEAPAKAKKRGRPPKTKAILRDPDGVMEQTLDVDAPETAGVNVGYIPINVVERYRAEVANFETLDDARKNYALDLLDRLLAELRG